MQIRSTGEAVQVQHFEKSPHIIYEHGLRVMPIVHRKLAKCVKNWRVMPIVHRKLAKCVKNCATEQYP